MPRDCETSDEIEITPEMTEKGVDAFLLGWGVNDAEVAVEAIYRAMISARPIGRRARLDESDN